MRLDFANERVLAIVAHPDDAELLCAGTLARAKHDGAAVGIGVLCRGDKGQPNEPIANLADVRREEMMSAAEILGAELFTGEFGDSELYDSPASRRVVVDILRRFRPTLLLGHSPSDYHTDHRATSALVDVASWMSASTGYATEHEPLAEPPVLWWMDNVEMIAFEPHGYIDVSEVVDVKHRMLACHASQLARGGDENLSPLEEVMVRQYSTRGAQARVRAAEAFRFHASWKRIGAF
ncbi:4-oxalmesaconate hydratase [Planctomycetes bacterium Pan216]|uniref:4-oxalmesaconate hydratase n=1 Tax=Kolteria novifilia TaxID=2527975 RepID=A0A518BBG6_9BACT|nr:4-oxalmesaconate hydratase [Planctomycetes bacterium Pan216]